MDLLTLLSMRKQVPGETATQGMDRTTPLNLGMPIVEHSTGGSNIGVAGEPITNRELPLRPGTDSSGALLPLRNVLMRNAVNRNQSTGSPMGLLL